jgi:hypothetical protein
MHCQSVEVRTMRIRRIALMAMVALAPVTAALAGDHVAAPAPETGRTASTVLRPASPPVPDKSPAATENSRQKTLALLILLLREGRGAR